MEGAKTSRMDTDQNIQEIRKKHNLIYTIGLS
jgi:hypothetical protein